MAQTKDAPLILTVSQLTQAIKFQLESTFPLIWLKGEVTNLKLQTSGHLYFSIKDEWAQIAAVMFRADLSKVSFPIKVGDQILVRGELNVWPPKGNYQLIVREISLVGLGEQLLKLEQLKQKLQALGWFDIKHKKPLPRFPKTIGVVTSPTGAVIQDILNILSRRFVGFHLILNPVRVQGDGAKEEIALAIKQFNDLQLVDVLIVGRGGGSFEDLAAFNSELVAKAIFESTIPVVSAVGHETDISIADLVADVRAPTPSAAAELVSQEQALLLETLYKYHKTIYQLQKQLIARKKDFFLRFIKQPIFSSTTALLGPSMQRLDEYRELVDQNIVRILEKSRQDFMRMKRTVESARPDSKIRENQKRLLLLEKALNGQLMRKLEQHRRELEQKNKQLSLLWQHLSALRKRHFAYPQFEIQIPSLIQKIIISRKKELARLIEHLQSLNPKNLLKKGYSICFSQKDGSIITSVTGVSLGDPINVLLQDGKIEATVNAKIPDLEAQKINAIKK